MPNPFRRKKKASAASYPGPARDPLAAVPHIVDGVESRSDPADRLHLRRPIPPANRYDALFTRIFRANRHARVELDAYGTYYWRQIDGRRDLHAIAHAIATHFDISVDDARNATLTFTRDLMLRHLLQLEIRTEP